VVNGKNETVKTVFAQVRRGFGGDGFAAVILNTDREKKTEPITLCIKAPKGYTVEEWDTESGKRYSAAAFSTYENGVYRVNTDLAAAGTRCFVLNCKKEELPCAVSYETVTERTVEGEFPYTCDEQNACVLDYCRWRWKNGEWHGDNEVLRVDRQIRSELGIEWRGGQMLQPWYSKLHHKKRYGELQLAYEFYIDVIPTEDLVLAGERPELNTYKINGAPLNCKDENDFWIDGCFKKMTVPVSALRLGRNEVTVDVNFMRTTNIEAIYLIGNFGVRLDGHKRTLTEEPHLMGCKNYAEYCMPFFSGNLTFTVAPEMFADVLGDSAETADRIVLTPKDFTGACVKVSAGDRTELLSWDPYEADVTEAYRRLLPINVTVFGTRANLFGPLHETNRPAPSCGPGNFVTGGERFTEDYSLINSGLRGFTFKAQKKRER
jgi:hypothetical protein